MRRKKTLPLTSIMLGLCFLLIGSSFGQTTYTAPSGYVRHDLLTGFNPIGLNLHKSKVANGTITGEVGTTITDSNAAFLTTLPNTATVTYLLEILDGPQAGAVAEIASVTDDTNIELIGALSAGTTTAYCIRPAATMNETFGVGAAAQLTGSFNADAADIVWVPNGAGDYDQFFYNSVAMEFRDASQPFAAALKPIIWFYPDGAFIQRKGAATTLTFFGDVKLTPTIVAGLGGGVFNLVTVPSPSGETLSESNLDDWLTGSFNADAADILWVPDGAGGYIQYFYNGVAGVWRLASSPFAGDENGTTLPSAILIQRKGVNAAGPFDLPAYFSSL